MYVLVWGGGGGGGGGGLPDRGLSLITWVFLVAALDPGSCPPGCGATQRSGCSSGWPSLSSPVPAC